MKKKTYFFSKYPPNSISSSKPWNKKSKPLVSTTKNKLITSNQSSMTKTNKLTN